MAQVNRGTSVGEPARTACGCPPLPRPSPPPPRRTWRGSPRSTTRRTPATWTLHHATWTQHHAAVRVASSPHPSLATTPRDVTRSLRRHLRVLVVLGVGEHLRHNSSSDNHNSTTHHSNSAPVRHGGEDFRSVRRDQQKYARGPATWTAGATTTRQQQHDNNTTSDVAPSRSRWR